MDAFAFDCGVDVGVADPELKEILIPGIIFLFECFFECLFECIYVLF
jgi:hypothetical protein